MEFEKLPPLLHLLISPDLMWLQLLDFRSMYDIPYTMLESSLNDINREEIELHAANLHEISKKKAYFTFMIF